jgi:hypothetical protein
LAQAHTRPVAWGAAAMIAAAALRALVVGRELSAVTWRAGVEACPLYNLNAS